MSAIFAALLSAAYSYALPIIQKQLGLAISQAGSLNFLDVLKSARVGICAFAGAAVVAFLGRVIPDGLATFAAVGVVAAVLDTAYRLRKGE